MTTRHADFKYQMCIIVVLLHFTWLCVTRCTAELISLSLAWHADQDAIRTWSFHTIPPLFGLTLRCALWFLRSLERLQKRTQILTPGDSKVSVKTGSWDVSICCISSQFLAHFNSGGPFGGICTSARLDKSAVSRVCEETLEKVQADCLKDGSNVT